MVKINKYSIRTVTDGMSIELNPEDFRGLEFSYNGESDEEFLDYLTELEDVYYDEEGLDEELKDKLCDFFEFSNSEEVSDTSDSGRDFDMVLVEEGSWDARTFEWLIERM